MKLLFLLLFVFCYYTGHPQYFGSSGDGHDVSGIVGTRIDGVILLNSAIFQGGVGDGFTETKRILFLSTSVSSAYPGGRGDGHAVEQITTALSGIELFGIYAGGDADGFSSKEENLVLSGINLSVLYTGGLDDGFDTKGIQASLSGVVLALFDGGDQWYEPSLDIYPNPNRSRILNLEITGIPQNDPVTLIIYDSKGQFIDQLELIEGCRKIDLSWEWPAGIYYLHLRSDDIRLSKNLIIVD
ncbi:MAG: T9SS type A sorting domain-containing protein [Bacteroidota bacterium]